MSVAKMITDQDYVLSDTEMKNVPVTLHENTLEDMVNSRGNVHVIGITTEGTVSGEVPEELKALSGTYDYASLGKTGHVKRFDMEDGNGSYIVMGLGSKNDWKRESIRDSHCEQLDKLRDIVGKAYEEANRAASEITSLGEGVTLSFAPLAFDIVRNAHHSNEEILSAIVNGAMRSGDEHSRNLLVTDSSNYTKVKEIRLFVPDKEDYKETFETATKYSQGENIAQLLFETPYSHLDPDKMLACVEAVVHGSNGNLQMEVTSFDEIKDHAKGLKGADSDPAFRPLYEVSKGTERAHLVRIKYRGDESDQHITTIGKGLTYDTGGTDIKPANGMKDMYGDMGGAATAIGVAHALAHTDAKVNVDFWLPITDNFPGPNSYVSGNRIIVGHDANGEAFPNITVLNTDAEGRNVMSTALMLAGKEHQREENSPIAITLSTLTGAQLNASGTYRSTAMAPIGDDVAYGIVTDMLVPAGHYSGQGIETQGLNPRRMGPKTAKTGEKTGYHGNTGGDRLGGHLDAQMFLSRYAKQTGQHYVGVDIASTLTRGKGDPIGAHLNGLQFDTLPVSAIANTLVQIGKNGYTAKSSVGPLSR